MFGNPEYLVRSLPYLLPDLLRYPLKTWNAIKLPSLLKFDLQTDSSAHHPT